MEQAPVRRPIRAFLLTPPVFAGLFVLCFVVPGFFTQSNEANIDYTFDDYMLAYSWSVLYFVSATLVSYFAIALAIPVYFILRKSGNEHAWMPVVFGTFLTGLIWEVTEGKLIVGLLIGSVSGLIFWRLYSDKWWGRIESE